MGILLICLFVFLFCLYAYVHDDFVLIRKNISTEQIFNIASTVLVVSLLSARLYYIAFHYNQKFLHPLVFLLFPYFPGLSITGGIIGAAIFVTYYLRSPKIPREHIADILAVATLCALQTGLLLSSILTILQHKIIHFPVIVLPVLYIVAFLYFAIILVPFYKSGGLKEGTPGLLFLVVYSCISFFLPLHEKAVKILSFLYPEDILLIVVFFTSLFFICQRENVIEKLQKQKKYA